MRSPITTQALLEYIMLLGSCQKSMTGDDGTNEKSDSLCY